LGFVPMRTPTAEPASPGWRDAAFLAPRGGGIVMLTLDPVGDGGGGAQLNLLHLR